MEKLSKILRNYKLAKLKRDIIETFCLIDNSLSLNVNEDSIKDTLNLEFYSDRVPKSFDVLLITEDDIYVSIKSTLDSIKEVYDLPSLSPYEIDKKIEEINSIKDYSSLTDSLKDEFSYLMSLIDTSSVINRLIKIKEDNDRHRKNSITLLDLKVQNKVVSLTKEEYEDEINEIYKRYPKLDINKELTNYFFDSFKKICIKNLGVLKNLNTRELTRLTEKEYNKIDFTKLELVIASTIRKNAENNINNSVIVMKALYYLCNYVKDNKELVRKGYEIFRVVPNERGDLIKKIYRTSSIVSFVASTQIPEDI